MFHCVFWTNVAFFSLLQYIRTLASFNLSLNNNVQVDLLQTLDFYPLTSLSEKKCAKRLATKP